MPTYEYRCANGHEFEQFQRMSEAPLDTCPVCGAAAERLLSAGAGLLFKGSGFYITDYRNDSYRKAAAADSGAGGSDSGAKSGGESAGKPAAEAGKGSAEKGGKSTGDTGSKSSGEGSGSKSGSAPSGGTSGPKSD
jgi:putative FmdB family regulatory protein